MRHLEYDKMWPTLRRGSTYGYRVAILHAAYTYVEDPRGPPSNYPGGARVLLGCDYWRLASLRAAIGLAYKQIL